MQTLTTTGGESELTLRLRRAKYESNSEAVLLCTLAAEEIVRLRYDLAVLKSQCARLAAARVQRISDVKLNAAPGGRGRAAAIGQEARPS